MRYLLNKIIDKIKATIDSIKKWKGISISIDLEEEKSK